MASALTTAITQAAPMVAGTGSIAGGNAAVGLGGNSVFGGNTGLGKLGSFGIGAIMALNKSLNQQAEAKAYQNYLNQIAGDMAKELTARADKYDTKLQNQVAGLEGKMLAQPSQYEEKMLAQPQRFEDELKNLLYDSEPQYLKEANTQLPELTQLVNDIAQRAAEAQRANQKQVNASLAQQGIRGGQAAILANRATGELNRDLQRDINETVYNEAANRQNSRLNYTQNKALLPYQALAGAYGSSMQNANNNIGSAYANTYTNAANNISNAYGSSFTGANNALSSAYGSSLSGANNALSGAQGNTYYQAYKNAMDNYKNANTKRFFGLF